MQLLLMDGAINICWSKDLHFPLFFVLASLDTVSALTLSPIGTCFGSGGNVGEALGPLFGIHY